MSSKLLLFNSYYYDRRLFWIFFFQWRRGTDFGNLIRMILSLRRWCMLCFRDPEVMVQRHLLDTRTKCPSVFFLESQWHYNWPLIGFHFLFFVNSHHIHSLSYVVSAKKKTHCRSLTYTCYHYFSFIIKKKKNHLDSNTNPFLMLFFKLVSNFTSHAYSFFFVKH